MNTRTRNCVTFLLPLLLPFLGAACGDQQPAAPTDKPAPAGGTAPATDPGHVHGERTPLGTVEVGGYQIAVFQVAPVVAGKEADFDLDFGGDKQLPAIVRGWIGIESGVGSAKVKFAKETDRRMHGQPEVPGKLAEGMKFWLEVDDGGARAAGSVAWKQ
jgi:hypothetical protein